jgi:Ran GTPase-activating protein (RanGAP) involved in mRNA processing and transport
MRHLTTLVLDNILPYSSLLDNPMSKSELKKLDEGLPPKEDLSLGIGEIINSPVMFGLKTLSLYNFIKADKIVAELANSHYALNLNTLNLGGCYLKDESVIKIAESIHLSNLKNLDISRNLFNAKSVIALSKSFYMSQLEDLKLRDCFLSDESVIALATSPYMSKLRKLNLGSQTEMFANPVRNPAIIALANSRYLTQLEVLDLEDTLIEDEAIKALTESPYLRKITNLNLSRCQRLTNDTLNLIATGLSFSELKELNIDKCREISDEGILALITSTQTPKLCFVSHIGIQMSDETRNRLVEALKNNLNNA